MYKMHLLRNAGTDGSGAPIDTPQGGEGGDKDVAGLLARLDKLEQKVQEAEAYEKHVATLMGTDVPEHLVPGAIQAVYGKLGYQPAQIQELMERWQNRNEDTSDDDDEDDDDDDDDEDTRKTPPPQDDPMNKQEMARLKQEIDRLNSKELGRDQERIRNLVKQKAETTVDSSPEVGKLLEAVRRRSDPDTAESEVRAVRDQMVATAQRTLGGRIRESYDAHVRLTGDRTGWDDGWIERASPKLDAEIVKEFRPAIGDPSLVGRSTETGVGTSIAEMLRDQKKVEAPEYKPGMDRGDLEVQVRQWSTQELLTALAGDEAGTKI